MATNRHRRAAIALSATALLASTLQVAGAGSATASSYIASGTTSETVSRTAATATTATTAAAATASSRWRTLASRTRTATTTTTTATATTTTSTPSARTPLPTSDSPSGTSAPRGSLAGWRQVYAEDFSIRNATGSFPSGGYERHWDVYEDGWKDTSKNGTYMPSKVLSTHDGVLDYDIHSEGSTRMVAAPWLTDTKGTTYGRYSVRFRADALPGYKTAWLLWPDSERWPTDGEIDFPEGNLGATDTIHAFHHYASSGGGQDAFPTRATFAGWHTVTVEWVPGKVTFILDGKAIGSSTTMVPTTAMHWVLQTETNLDGYAPSTAVRGHVLVDWVSFWTRA